jgi:hypothetical protein
VHVGLLCEARMTTELKELIDETMELTGAAAPAVMDADAPVLELNATAEQPIYLVGLIGGKEVGKSSLVNALVGQTISEQSAHGAGTEEVIAYAHHTAAEELRELLDRVAAGKYRIVPHNVGELSRQVLVDLPDIDSHWVEHVALTRKMLRHLLYPLWIQSIEKYADIQPQRLLAQVAAGNDPANFVFCLNKADQLREAEAAAEELRNDYAARLKKTLSLGAAPKVYLISAQQPLTRDLPLLRAMLSNQKSTSIVRQSMQLAESRQDRSVLRWLDAQQLSARAEAAGRLLAEAEELLAARVAVPLLETQLPRLQNDAGYQMCIIEPAVQRRLSSWPLVNVVNTAFLPLMALVQKNVGNDAAGEQVRAPALQGAFALLHQSQPAIGPLYRQRNLWETLPAAEALDDLRRRITETIERQAAEAIDRVARPSIVFVPVRWLVTIGALIWFPIAQPLLQAMLAPTWSGMSRDVAFLAVQLLSAAYLLKSVSFLIIYFVVLWATLRWDTRRRIVRLLKAWARVDAEPALSLPAQAMEWVDDLLEPLARQVRTAGDLAERLKRVRGEIEEERLSTRGHEGARSREERKL